MIRKATRYDIPMLLDLVREYNKEIPIKVYKNKELHDETYVSNLLFTLIKGRGFVLIDDEINNGSEIDYGRVTSTSSVTRNDFLGISCLHYVYL